MENDYKLIIDDIIDDIFDIFFNRLKNMSENSFRDFSSLIETYRGNNLSEETKKTMKELLFPELIGKIKIRKNNFWNGVGGKVLLETRPLGLRKIMGSTPISSIYK